MTTSLADRHAETMGMRYDHDTQLFYIRDGRYVIGLKRNNRTQQHRVSMCTVPGRVFKKLHDQTYTDLDTAILVAHGLARRYGVSEPTEAELFGADDIEPYEKDYTDLGPEPDQPF